MAEEKEVKASQKETVTAEQQEIAEKIVENVQEEVKQEVTEQVTEQQKPLTAEEIRQQVESSTTKALNSFKGSFANWTASQQKELKKQIDEVLNPLRKQAELIEESRLQDMSAEEQVEYYKSRLEEKQNVPEELPAQQQEISQEQAVLADMTQDLLNEYNLGTNIRDTRIWEGYQEGMSTRQALNLAERNIKKLTIPNEPAQVKQEVQQNPVKEEQTPIPSTSGAPKSGSGRVTSQTDLAEMMANGQIDATQFRNAKNEINRQGYASL